MVLLKGLFNNDQEGGPKTRGGGSTLDFSSKLRGGGVLIKFHKFDNE